MDIVLAGVALFLYRRLTDSSGPPMEPKKGGEAVVQVVAAGLQAMAMTLEELNTNFGLEQVELACACDEGATLMREVQALFDATFQDRPDRDVSRHKPCRLVVEGVQGLGEHHTRAAREEYLKARSEIEARGAALPFPTLTDGHTVTGVNEDLKAGVNEKLLFHGADAKYANAIMMTRVRVPEADQVVHGAIYGVGAHFAESATKADQYAYPAMDGPNRGLYPMILSRVLLGSVRELGVATPRESFPDEALKAELRATVTPLGKKFSSICGDRRNPPASMKGGFNHYRELILYNECQSYPALLVWYSRQGQSRDQAVALARMSVPEGVFEHHLRMYEGFERRVGLLGRTGRIGVLGDVSGSMSSGNRMPCLQKAFQNLVTTASQEGRPLVLAAWNSWVSFHVVQAKQGGDAWIASLKPGGGNDMRFAIEQTMMRYPDIIDCFVMCDGDVSPFAISGPVKTCLSNVPQPESPGCESSSSCYNGTDWETFRGRWPTAHFHFIAFGNGADVNKMRKMADVGGGTLTVMAEA